MEYLFENPIPMLMVGAVLLTFVAVLYYTTKGTGAFVAMVLIAVLLCSALVMEQIVYTERELVEVSLGGITDALEANDQAGVLLHLSPSATETRALVEKLMPQLDIEKANISSEVEITLDDEKNPTRATAKFRGFFHAKHQSGMAGGRPFPVEVDLVRHVEQIDSDGKVTEVTRWLIESFRSDDDFERQAARLIK